MAMKQPGEHLMSNLRLEEGPSQWLDVGFSGVRKDPLAITAGWKVVPKMDCFNDLWKCAIFLGLPYQTTKGSANIKKPP